MKSIGKYLFEGIVILLSILGAFWLEEWGDDKERKEKAIHAISAIKSEIVYNLNAINTDADNFRMFDELKELSDRTNNQLILSALQLDSLKNLYPENPELFNALSAVDTLDNGKVKYQLFTTFYFIPTDFSDITYESVKNSGVAMEIDYETMKYINFCFQWIHKDFGVNSGDFFRVLNGSSSINNDEDFQILIDALIREYSIKRDILDTLSHHTFNLMEQYR